ncbi:hypothetical protein QYM36_017436 [Artemia franciscana]|uniref:Uncharacterized protein n=1 Tax=Artemia franciscana TaxID=6661 RepID=A0AA88HHE3_ARTSF|nr:hypothetical protein QYM36_017436 [Artemia franciscana]
MVDCILIVKRLKSSVANTITLPGVHFDSDPVLASETTLKNNQAPGPGGIPANLLKVGSITLEKILHKETVAARTADHFPKAMAKVANLPLERKLFLHAALSLLENKVGLNIIGVSIDTLAYADNLNSPVETTPKLKAKASELESAANSFDKTIVPKKMKVMRTGRDPSPSPVHVVISGEAVESVTQFEY